MKINVGIDLGTTYSAVATFNKSKGAVEILKNDLDKNCTPSVVCIENGTVTIGEEAKDMQAAGNLNTAAFYKSMMGEKDYTVYIDGREYTPEDLSSEFLRVLKRNVEEANNVEIGGAVITVPAYFNEAQRTATMRAGKKAGLDVLKIINEPTSAIIAYGLTGLGRKNVMVYDLGGGTFDVTIAEVDGAKVKVISTNGNHQLGGKDWDLTLVEEMGRRFLDEYGVNIEDYPEEYKELQVKCEDVKKKLTNVSTTTVTVQCEGYSGRYEVSREFFDEQTANLLNETIILVNKCFEEIGNGFGWHSLDEVVLVGGSTRMPQVKEMIIREYGKPPITKNIDVDTIVAAGAAMQAQLCTENMLVLGGTSAPRAGGTIGGGSSGLVIRGSDIQDITAHSLGILVYDNEKDSFQNSIIIKKGSEYNKYFSKEYFSSSKEIDIYILQGESNDPFDCELLCKYIIESSNSGKSIKTNVELCYNNNGIVDVRASSEFQANLNVKKEFIEESLYSVLEELKEKNKKSALPYSKWAGVSNIPTTNKDKFGNPEGAQYDLAVDGGFKGYNILILNLCEVASMSKAVKAMEKKGFNVELIPGKIPSPSDLERKLRDKCQLWIISQADLQFTEKHYSAIKDFYDEGHGIYVWGDNDPLNTNANFIISRMFGSMMGGDYYARKVLSIQTEPKEPGIVADHLISTGMVSFFEGDSIANIQLINGLKPLIYSSDRKVVTAFYDDNGKRALIDGAFTRLWDGDWGQSAGTERYIVNAACWLANLEKFGYNPTLK